MVPPLRGGIHDEARDHRLGPLQVRPERQQSPAQDCLPAADRLLEDGLGRHERAQQLLPFIEASRERDGGTFREKGELRACF